MLNPFLYKLSYDPVKNCEPIGLIAATALVPVIGAQMPVISLGELPAAGSGSGYFSTLSGQLECADWRILMLECVIADLPLGKSLQLAYE